MGVLSKLKKLVGLAEKHEDTIAKAASKKSSKIDEEDVKKAVDKASEMTDESSKGSN
ncbi:MAG: hypothetical protein ABEJ85_03035 [Haloarculaceae archaeon]